MKHTIFHNDETPTKRGCTFHVHIDIIELLY